MSNVLLNKPVARNHCRLQGALGVVSHFHLTSAISHMHHVFGPNILGECTYLKPLSGATAHKISEDLETGSGCKYAAYVPPLLPRLQQTNGILVVSIPVEVWTA